MNIQKNSLLSVTLIILSLLSTATLADTVNAVFDSPTDVPIITNSYTATGNTVDFTLNFVPNTGGDLMVVKNTGAAFIDGTFDNLTNHQLVALSYGGSSYNFEANYYGGSGNDLVLVWTNRRAFAWGYNGSGQLGDGTSGANRLLPVPMTATGALAGKTVISLAAGASHSLALCSDGTLAAWGDNTYGQLGDNSTVAHINPAAVNTASGVSALHGKTVIAIAAGAAHSLALCSDGTVVAWGYNNYGQLGDSTTTQQLLPTAVNTTEGVSALYGKMVTAIAAGASHSLALCSDGTLVAWGANQGGQLGDNTTATQRLVPTAVDTSAGASALSGKTVVAIAAGNSHSLALCSDATVAGWGSNIRGQLGDNSTTTRRAPTAVLGLYGKGVTAIAAGAQHSLALRSDGTVAAWGFNEYGQVGDTTISQRLVPSSVNTSAGVSALYGKTVVAIAAGYYHSLALCSDGTMAAWGYNSYGQLGNNTAGRSSAPWVVNSTPLNANERFVRVFSSSSADYTLALVAATPSSPRINAVGNSLSITNGDCVPGVADGTDFGSAAMGGSPVVRTFTIQNTGTVPLNLTGTPRVTVNGSQPADFTVSSQPASTVPAAGATTFQVAFAPSTVGNRTAIVSIASDDGSQTPFTFAIQGVGTGALNASYTTGKEVPVATAGFTATGNRVNFALNYAPATGTELMVVKNTGLDFIDGTFENLTNGQRVVFSLGGTNYAFWANYYGGSGNDLVLAWAEQRPLAAC